MKINFQADDVRVNVTADAAGRLVPSLASAHDGSVLIEFGKAEIEAMLLTFAQAAAAGQGAKVESAELTLVSRGDRAVEASVRVKAKKAFVPAVVTVTGRADVDERLTVTVSRLACIGEGMIGQMVSGLLATKLREHEGKSFPLAGDALKNVKLKSLKVDAGDPLRVTAAFES
jgi:hypothetical protein